MADKITIGLDDQTAAGAASVEQNLQGIAQAADGAQDQLNDAGQAARHLAYAAADLRDLEAQLEAAESAVNELEHEFRQAQAEAKKLAAGGKDVSGSLLKLAGGVVAIEAIKRAVQGALQAIKALSDNGSPAFVELQGSIDGAYQALLGVADDPTIQQFASGLADGINNTLVPAIKSIPAAWNEFNDTASRTLTYLGETFGIFAEGTLETNEEIIASNERIRQQLAEQTALRREQINVDEQLAAIQDKLAAEQEMAAIQAIDDEVTLQTLLNERVEALRELVNSGERNKDKEKESLREIETIQRRLVQLPKERATAEIRAQEAASQARADAAKEFADNIAAMQEQAATAEREKLEQAMQQATETAERLLKLVQEAKGTSGQNLLEQARGSIGPQQVRSELQRQAAEQARQRVIDEQRASGRADQNLMGIGGTPAERAAATRRLEREREAAAQQASRGAAMQFNRGGFDQQAIFGAQNSLIQGAVQTAQSRGQVDDSMVSALTQALNVQQQEVQAHQETQQRVQQLERAFASLGGNISGNRQRAIAGGLRR